MENGLLVCETKETGDYHKDMNPDMFEQMFKFSAGALITVMNNAKYHFSQKRRNQAMTNSAKYFLG